jgi:mRNA interferase RelE/StbE
MYQVYVTSRARKQLRRIAPQYHTRIKELLIFLESNPIPHKKYDIVKMDGKVDTYRIRIGDIRVMYELNLHDKEISVLAIMPRSSAYKKSY